MDTAIFQGIQCWEAERISDVINKEASSIDRAVFLATHAPMNNLTYLRKPPVELADDTEETLLRELQRCAIEDRHAFVVVQGIPGTGKSNLIRWLKERYMAELERLRGTVLFIERAQCNLRGTLEQVLASGIFDDATSREQLEKLKGATIVLSQEALADTLLNQLHVVVTHDGDVPGMPKWLVRDKHRLELLLLDSKMREELKKPGGPIERLVRFLSTGSRVGMGRDESPEFEGRDFEISVDLLNAIKREGYSEARQLAEFLQDSERDKQRGELASYLTSLLNKVIGRATALNADDLKRMFNDLRHSLRQQNRHLALFIEDITAFTGIDAGLVDVLATQHTGEGNREFCQMISVIGITDHYYRDLFPENIKARVTHHITLNTLKGEGKESALLTNQTAVADLSARYLNAMRLSQAKLDVWYDNKARPEDTPNQCDGCQYKATCHAAFGSVEIARRGEEPLRVGLYPFNQRALWTMYENIDTTNTARTPRALLSSVVEYVLGSHGQKVKRGQFPPPVDNWGGEFKVPSLSRPLQRPIIERQGETDAKRIQSLLVFWGNRTVTATQVDNQQLLGGLPEAVFTAFNLRFIPGEVQEVPSQQTAPASREVAATVPLASSSTVQSSLITAAPTAHVETQAPPAPRTNKYIDAIDVWSRNGQLVESQYFSERLSTLIRTFIDWEAYGISNAQVDDLLRGYRRIYIEGQRGKPTAAYYITFERSSELATVLHAVADLSEGNLSLDKALLGGHLIGLVTWLQKQEPSIVDFVLQAPAYEGEQPSPSLPKLLLLVGLFFACLKGDLELKGLTTHTLLLDVLKSCSNIDGTSWLSSVNEAQQFHSSAWKDLMRRIGPQRVETCAKELPRMLNRTQGDRSSVFFIDAAQALDILTEFRKQEWQLSSVEPKTSSTTLWTDASTIYATIQQAFPQVLAADREYVQAHFKKLQSFIELGQPEEVFRAITTLNDTLTSFGRGQLPEPKRYLTAPRLKRILVDLQSILEQQSIETQALHLSAASSFMQTTLDYLQYFADVCQEIDKQMRAAAKTLANLRDQLNNEQLPTLADVQQHYDEIVAILTEAVVPQEVGR